MTHPLQLHATAALYSLARIWPKLDARVEQEARIAARQSDVDARDGLKSAVMSTGGGSSGYGDPVASTALTWSRPAPLRLARLRASTQGTLEWIAMQVDPIYIPYQRPVFEVLLEAIQRRSLTTAWNLTLWLRELDTTIRRELGAGPDEWPLSGIACPACGQRRLLAQTAAPDSSAWTVVCACECGGDGCPCGMLVTAAGVQHIWTADSPLAKASLTQLSGGA